MALVHKGVLFWPVCPQAGIASGIPRAFVRKWYGIRD